MTEPHFSKPEVSQGRSEPGPSRINPWRMFIGSLVPNWLQRRHEVSQGAKLAYGRLAQYAGKNGKCFPKQHTLATELGVSERTARKYLRELLELRLIESHRPGLQRPNNYFFLDHPWMHEAKHEKHMDSVQERQNPPFTDRPRASGPIVEESQLEKSQEKSAYTHHTSGLPVSLEDAIELARRLGIEEAFASQEFHAKKSVGWKDGYGNPITSWVDHLQARWPTEQRKRLERQTARSKSTKGGSQPRRQFNSGDYGQSVDKF